MGAKVLRREMQPFREIPRFSVSPWPRRSSAPAWDCPAPVIITTVLRRGWWLLIFLWDLLAYLRTEMKELGMRSENGRPLRCDPALDFMCYPFLIPHTVIPSSLLRVGGFPLEFRPSTRLPPAKRLLVVGSYRPDLLRRGRPTPYRLARTLAAGMRRAWSKSSGDDPLPRTEEGVTGPAGMGDRSLALFPRFPRVLGRTAPDLGPISSTLPRFGWSLLPNLLPLFLLFLRPGLPCDHPPRVRGSQSPPQGQFPPDHLFSRPRVRPTREIVRTSPGGIPGSGAASGR